MIQVLFKVELRHYMAEYMFTSVKFFYLSLVPSPLMGLKIPAKNPVTNACKFWSRIFLISVSHAHAHNSLRVWSFMISSNLCSFQSQEASACRLFYSRIKGLASGTEMTGRELHHFFHFDMPPYLVILLLSINIVVIANECNNWSFLLLWGQ